MTLLACPRVMALRWEGMGSFMKSKLSNLTEALGVYRESATGGMEGMKGHRREKMQARKAERSQNRKSFEYHISKECELNLVNNLKLLKVLE